MMHVYTCTCTYVSVMLRNVKLGNVVAKVDQRQLSNKSVDQA